jgi:hypothetical protein
LEPQPAASQGCSGQRTRTVVDRVVVTTIHFDPKNPLHSI